MPLGYAFGLGTAYETISLVNKSDGRVFVRGLAVRRLVP
jgi:hypothetical protein